MILINDTDLAIPKDQFYNVKRYLEDLGFKETENTYTAQGYDEVVGSRFFTKVNYTPVHLCLVGKDFKVLKVSEILSEKMIRYSESDQKQLLDIVKNNLNKNWE